VYVTTVTVNVGMTVGVITVMVDVID